MDDQHLITEKPKIKRKGFKSENMRVVPATKKDIEVCARILKLSSTPYYTELAPDRKRVIDLVLEAYQYKVDDIPLKSEPYILSGHELVEFDRIEDHDVFRYLFYRYKYNKYPELKIVDDYPPCLQIEPSSICNYRCVMCYQIDKSFSNKGSGYMGFMSLEMFKDVIDQAEGNIEAITLASRGEPLLNKNIVEMLDYCRGKFLGLKINTNASILTDEIIHALLSSDVQTVAISIDAADRGLYKRIRVGGRFESILNNLERYNEIKAKEYPDSKAITRIAGVKINTYQDIESMEQMWSQYADIVAFTNYIPWQSAYDNPVNDIKDPCTELWRRMFVWQDGVVNPCDYDYKSMLSKWNIADMIISEIWTSDAYNDLRKHHLEKIRSKLEPCKRCISV